MMKAVIYTRVSTEEQAQQNHHSLEAQVRSCREFAEREGHRVVKMFEDAGKSGTTIKGRPALNDLIDYLEEKKDIKIVLIQDMDRIARSVADHVMIKSILKKFDCRLISVAQPNIDETAEGMLIENMMASISQFQSDQTKKKLKKGWNSVHLKAGFRPKLRSVIKTWLIKKVKKL